METTLDRETIGILIESFEFDNKTMVPTLSSEEGRAVLRERYGPDFNWADYLGSIKNEQEKTNLMINKLKTQNSFQEGFISELEKRLGLLLVNLYAGKICLESDERKSNEIIYEKLKKLFKKLYPKSSSFFDKLEQGKNPL